MPPQPINAFCEPFWNTDFAISKNHLVLRQSMSLGCNTAPLASALHCAVTCRARGLKWMFLHTIA
jgi:hypothetical protein